jgi:hypothetical protein
MAAITIVAAEVAPVYVVEQITGTISEAVTAGQYNRIDTTTGIRALGNATLAAEVGSFGGLALVSVGANQGITSIRKGIVSLGGALSALAYGVSVYLADADGGLNTVAGTVSTVVGRVIPGYGNTTPDKLLYIWIES